MSGGAGAGERHRPARSAHSLKDLLFFSKGDIGAGGVFAVILTLASVAATFLALAGFSLVGAGLITVVMLAALLGSPMFDHHTTEDRGLGVHPETQLLAVAGVGILGAHGAGLDVVAWLTLILLAGVLVGETALRRLHIYTMNTAVNLPGFAVHRSHRLPTQLINPGTIVAILLADLSAILGFTWVPALAVIVGVGALALTDFWGRLTLVRTAGRNRKRLARAVTDLQPTFALHWRADPGTDYQISMWLPYLERLNKPFFVITRSPANFVEASALTQAPVLLLRNMVDLDDVVVPSLKTVFYVNNATANSQMVRYPGLRHIMLNHGDSDKAPSYNPVSRMYDKNFVAGQAAIDRFTSHGVDITPEQFTIVGRPQIEDVAKANGPIGRTSRPTVLYAPTWAGFTADSAYSSLPHGPMLVEALLSRGCNVIFRPHPYAYRTPSLAAACARVIALLKADTNPDADHAFGDVAEKQWALAECFNHSDAMISDVSGVVADYLYSDKPLAMCAVHTDANAFAAEFPLAEAAYLLEVTTGGFTELDATLDRLLVSDPLAESRRRLRTYYLGDPGDRPYADLFFDAVAPYV